MIFQYCDCFVNWLKFVLWFVFAWCFFILDVSIYYNISVTIRSCLLSYQSHHQLQDALDVGLATQAHVHTRVSTSNTSCSWWWYCYMSKSTYGHALVLSSWRLVRPAADDYFFICLISTIKFHLEAVSDVFSTASRRPWTYNFWRYEYFGNWLEWLEAASQKLFL